jgi:hypothetical protein
MIAALRPAAPEPRPCKICGGAAPLYGVSDFNRSCEEERGRFLPLAGVAIYYRRCAACGFLFTDAFDDWRDEQFKAHIYNDGYLAVDPDYAETRPAFSAHAIVQLFGTDKARLGVLDYGGGNGTVARLLRGDGFRAAETYDPFTPEFAQRPEGRFEIVSCFETLEHLAHPEAGFAALAACVAEPGLVLFSTVVQPADFDTQKMGWWYIGPRNGHISLFSRPALATAWQRHGFTFASFNDNLHVAYRALPDFARHLMG